MEFFSFYNDNITEISSKEDQNLNTNNNIIQNIGNKNEEIINNYSKMLQPNDNENLNIKVLNSLDNIDELNQLDLEKNLIEEKIVGANLLNNNIVGKISDLKMNNLHFQREYYSRKRKRAPIDNFITSSTQYNEQPEPPNSSTTYRFINEEDMDGFPQRAFILDENAQEEYDKLRIQEEENDLKESKRIRIEQLKAKSEFHLDKKKDYKGKSFFHPPSWLKSFKPMKCYEPKKLVHVFEGHSKGVCTIQLFPKFGHLLLSGSYDGNVKIWDVLNHKKCIMTYNGHQKSISDISFRSDGRQFLSSSYDNTTLLWDTEKGKVVSSFKIESIPHCCKFHPLQDRNHQFLIGQQNKQITQWDSRSKQIVLTYDHKGPVKHIEFIRGKNGGYSTFASTSDDKTLRIWYFTHKGKGVPTEIKKVEDPTNSGFNFLKQHPIESSFLVSGFNSTISWYNENHPLYSYDKNKNFKHNPPRRPDVACGIDISPDGSYIVGGDSDGQIHIWNSEKNKNHKAFKAHQGICRMLQWHPTESSRLISCGSEDGLIKMWE